MSQIWVQGSHFSEVNGFNKKVWLVDHVIIVMLINVSAMGGLQKCPKFGVTLFGGEWLLLILMIVSIEKYGQLIIQSLLYTSMVCAIGGLPKSGKFTCSGHTF